MEYPLIRASDTLHGSRINRMAEKWHKNGSVDAGDRENRTCYTGTVYKWAPQGLLIFCRKGELPDEVLSVLWRRIAGAGGTVLPGVWQAVFGRKATD